MNGALKRARAAAAATGQYLGWDGPHFRGKDTEWAEIWTGDEFPFAARFGVLRKGFLEFSYRIAVWDEFKQLASRWLERPQYFLGLAAEQLALEAAFPQIVAPAPAVPKPVAKPLTRPLKTVSPDDLEIALYELGYKTEHQRKIMIDRARKRFPLLAENNPNALNAKIIAEAKPARKAVQS